jgi:hypothetical protein
MRDGRLLLTAGELGGTPPAIAALESGTTTFFETPCYLVRWMPGPARNAGTLKSRISINNTFNDGPSRVGNHLLSVRATILIARFLRSYDPETGKLQWKFYTVPMNWRSRTRNLAEPDAASWRRSSVDTGNLRSRD